MLAKLGLSKNFLRKVLHSIKSTLEVGIMNLQTIINTLRAKIYLGNVRKDRVAEEATELQEEYLRLEARQKIKVACNSNERH